MNVKPNAEPTDRQVRDCLARHGYAGAMYFRMCPPGLSAESIIVLPKENVSFHFSPVDLMYRSDGVGGVRPVTPFDVLATHRFGGDYAAALQAIRNGDVA